MSVTKSTLMDAIACMPGTLTQLDGSDRPYRLAFDSFASRRNNGYYEVRVIFHEYSLPTKLEIRCTHPTSLGASVCGEPLERVDGQLRHKTKLNIGHKAEHC